MQQAEEKVEVEVEVKLVSLKDCTCCTTVPAGKLLVTNVEVFFKIPVLPAAFTLVNAMSSPTLSTTIR